MKNNKFLLAVLLILVAIAVYFFVPKSNGTIKNELNDFAITDTASIDKIFIYNNSDLGGSRTPNRQSRNLIFYPIELLGHFAKIRYLLTLQFFIL